MAAITSADMIADIRRVYASTGGFSRRKYLKTGAFSERQICKTFGTFSKFQEAAGLADKTLKLVSPNTKGEKESVEFVGNLWNIEKVSRIHTLPELIAYFEVDEEIWEVERFKANKWEVGMKPPATTEYITTEDGRKIPAWVRFEQEPIITPLYQINATFKKRHVVVFAKQEIESIKQRALEELNKLKLVPAALIPTYRETRLASGNLLELNVPDLHAGKLAWSKETGYGNYDTEIALALFETAVVALLARSAHITFDRILFVVGNDLQHADTIGGTTTSGTQLDTDSRYHKVFVKIRERLVRIIRERLLPIAPVTVLGCPGNHDKTTAWHMVDSLQQRFFDNPDVEVMNDPTEFKVYQWGEVMLMFAHGNTGKKPDYPLTMATRYKEIWGSTTYREAHTGHIHQTMVQEFHGVRVRTLPALCEPDAWHAANNFVGNLRTAEAYAWNNQTGLINLAFYNAD